MQSLGSISTLAVIVALSLAACSRPSASGPGGSPYPQPCTGYPPVNKDRLLGRHDCWATGPKRADFRFTFDMERFEIQEKGKPIPEEVLEAVLGAGRTAGKIEGRYDVSGDTLILTGIRADGKGDFQDARIHTFNTGVVRFDFGKVQYVLGPRN
jgi:hypothetical protein